MEASSAGHVVRGNVNSLELIADRGNKPIHRFLLLGMGKFYELPNITLVCEAV